MDLFNYNNGVLHAEGIPLPSLAEQFGTPSYVYSRATLVRHWQAFDQAFEAHPHLICYAVKANSNIAILNLLARLGSGFDIVSVGELERVLKAGGDPQKVVFSGVGKRVDELERALEVGIRCFNVESVAELQRLEQLAQRLGKVAPVSIRVNPDVDPKTHPYISTGLKENKFGIPVDAAEAVYQQAARSEFLNVTGIDCHIGSQLTDIQPFLDALERVLLLADRLQAQGIEIHHLDLGGGLGIRYQDESPALPADYVKALFSVMGERSFEILLEPGRAIVGNAGILLSRVEHMKLTEYTHFAIIDAAMNDLMRPALYQAWQEIVPVNEASAAVAEKVDIVGPVCETGDFLGKQRALDLKEGDLIAIRSSGAYGFSMSSNYNTRPRPVEILVDGEQAYVIRERESVEDLMRGEQLLPE